MLTNPCDAFRGQSRSPNIVPFHMLGSFLLCNSNFVFKMCQFFDIRLKKCRNLESGSEVTQESLKMVPFDRLCIVFFSNFVPKIHHFWYIQLQKCCDLENRVRGPSRSLEISPFDRGHTTIGVL